MTPLPSFQWRWGAAALLLCSLAFPLHAEEPDWRARFEYWTGRERIAFRPPRTNIVWTVHRTDGGSVAGVLLGLDDEFVTLRTEFSDVAVPRESLSREDRRLLFREDYSRARALERVLGEKREWPLQHPSAEFIADRARRLTSLQFEEFAREQAGKLVYWTGNLEDVRLDFFGRNQAVLMVGGASAPIRVGFAIHREEGAGLQRHSLLRVAGRIRSIRQTSEGLRVTLDDASIDAVTPREEAGSPP